MHRVGAAGIGGFLLLFAAQSLQLPVGFLPGSSALVFGMATSGLLAVASLVVGAVLVAAAVRGGPSASSVSVDSPYATTSVVRDAPPLVDAALTGRVGRR